MVVDSSVWLEVFFSGPLKNECLKEMKGKKIFIPSLCYYECYKKLRMKLPEHEAIEAIASLQSTPCLDLNSEIALAGADLSLKHDLAMADSLVLAHAAVLRETLLTLDNDFAAIPGTKVLRASVDR